MQSNNEPVREHILANAHVLLRDAQNEANSLHTRYSASMNALQCVCNLQTSASKPSLRAKIAGWERSRYDPLAWPTEANVAKTVLYVSRVLKAAGRSGVR